MDIVNLGIVGYFLGVLLSFGLPYLHKWLNEGVRFDIKKVISEILGGIFVALAIVATPGFVEQLTSIASTYDYPSLYFIGVMLMAMGGGFSGNMVEKLGVGMVNRISSKH